jgi:hypothetical protein
MNVVTERAIPCVRVRAWRAKHRKTALWKKCRPCKNIVGNDPVNRVDPMGLYVESDQFIVDHMPDQDGVGNPFQSFYESAVYSKAGGCLNLKFTDHFYFGNGQPTSFTELGVRYAFERTNSFTSLLNEIKTEIDEQKSTCRGSDSKDGNATGEIFAIGRYTAEYTWGCRGSECKIFMSINDPFVDPFRFFDKLFINLPTFGGSGVNSHNNYEPLNFNNAWNYFYNLGGEPYDIYEQMQFKHTRH